MCMYLLVALSDTQTHTHTHTPLQETRKKNLLCPKRVLTESLVA